MKTNDKMDFLAVGENKNLSISKLTAKNEKYFKIESLRDIYITPRKVLKCWLVMRHRLIAIHGAIDLPGKEEHVDIQRYSLSLFYIKVEQWEAKTEGTNVIWAQTPNTRTIRMLCGPTRPCVKDAYNLLVRANLTDISYAEQYLFDGGFPYADRIQPLCITPIKTLSKKLFKSNLQESKAVLRDKDIHIQSIEDFGDEAVVPEDELLEA